MSVKPVTNEFLNQKLDYVSKAVDDVKDVLKNDYVTQDRMKIALDPIISTVNLLQKIVFGFITMILVAFAGYIISFVINKP